MSDQSAPLNADDNAGRCDGALQASPPPEPLARPHVLLPAAGLSLGCALVLLQPQPMLHPVLSLGIVLGMTAALFCYGLQMARETNDAVPGEHLSSAADAPLELAGAEAPACRTEHRRVRRLLANTASPPSPPELLPRSLPNPDTLV
jgi:hypothetical protein